MASPKHILVIRFSAMGDVAMTVPVIKNALEQNPSLQITVVSNSFFKPLFTSLERCHFHPADLKGKHKGAAGIFKLYRELKADDKFDAVADFHNVLRSKLLRSFFKLSSHKVAVIDKGRKEKKALTRKDKKILQPLVSSFERYADVLRKLAVKLELNKAEPVLKRQHLPALLNDIFSTGKKIIGVAPFAQHTEKMYPLEKMKNIVQQLTAQHTVLLFGGKGREAEILQQWEQEIPSVINTSGRFSFAEELGIISNIHLMISMDSANMHLASLYKVPVVSIWGATHPYAGFYGWAQNDNNIVSVALSCRPCSVFGNKPCWRGDHACMHMITGEMVLEKINRLL
ncbi:MAG: glycosyltransferase family 9 protein [Ferruginibacter sp.]